VIPNFRQPGIVPEANNTLDRSPSDFMAAAYLAQHGIDLDSIIAGDAKATSSTVSLISNVLCLTIGNEADTAYDVTIENGGIASITPHTKQQLSTSHLPGVIDGECGLLAPSLCHAHVHLDKCFLLQDAKYSDLQIVTGDFAEAMSLTGQAKQRFSEDDLLRRGRRLIEDSVQAGVTCMRAFIEVDEVAQLQSLNAGLKLKEEFKDRCFIQICAFAQLAVFDDSVGHERRKLIEEAILDDTIEVIGATPYVEDSPEKMKQCVSWAIGLALKHKLHLDFHLDYNLDANQTPLVWNVIDELKRQQWTEIALPTQKICLGHCTRLTLFSEDDWKELAHEIGSLPISFVGLPTSDLFMMGRPESPGSQRQRATLQLPEMVQQYGLSCAMSINNIGNAFTPWGAVDPIALASLGMGVYQSGTKSDAELLYVSL
jgi:cytosine/adenosine deaminase-related metal-dependent hydrolase